MKFQELVLIWVPPKADSGTKIWIQVVHLGGDLRKHGEGGEK